MAGEVKPPEVRAISPPLGGEAIACKKKVTAHESVLGYPQKLTPVSAGPIGRVLSSGLFTLLSTVTVTTKLPCKGAISDLSLPDSDLF
jgi:hypothetical protein